MRSEQKKQVAASDLPRWHYPSRGELPDVDENMRILFYVEDRYEADESNYCHPALGFYRPAFMQQGVKLFVEQSKGYSCEHLPSCVIAWQYIELPEGV